MKRFILFGVLLLAACADPATKDAPLPIFSKYSYENVPGTNSKATNGFFSGAFSFGSEEPHHSQNLIVKPLASTEGLPSSNEVNQVNVQGICVIDSDKEGARRTCNRVNIVLIDSQKNKVADTNTDLGGEFSFPLLKSDVYSFEIIDPRYKLIRVERMPASVTCEYELHVSEKLAGDR